MLTITQMLSTESYFSNMTLRLKQLQLIESRRVTCGACSTHGEIQIHPKFYPEILKVRDHSGDRRKLNDNIKINLK